MAALTESRRAGEFIVSQGNGAISREVATLASGQNVVDGTVLAFNEAGKLVKMTLIHPADALAGVVIGNWDASATGTNADIIRVPYIARLAEFNEALVAFPE